MGKMRFKWVSVVVTGVLGLLFCALYFTLPANVYGSSRLIAREYEPMRRLAPKNMLARKVSGTQAQIAVQNLGTPLLTVSGRVVCVGDLSGTPTWLISGWIIGREIYKAYQDPELVCPGAYPFTINEVHILLEITPDPSLLPLLSLSFPLCQQ